MNDQHQYLLLAFKNLRHHGISWQTWFDINRTNYKIISPGDSAHADFCLDRPLKCAATYSRILKFDVWHNFENQRQYLAAKTKDLDCGIITNAYDPQFDAPNIVFNDFLFNRTKAYYSQYPFTPMVKIWYHDSNLSYVNALLTDGEEKKKIFVAPNKTYKGWRTRKYRSCLVDHLKSYEHLGYLGNHDDDSTRYLYSNRDFPEHTVDDLDQETRPTIHSGFFYDPPHSGYYKNTFISLYGETVEFGSSIAVTEKTYDPLIKGHFILPFSCTGFIKYLNMSGIKFPDFIDYSYDSIADNDARFQAYAAEIDRLMAFDIDHWRQLWKDNLGLVHANQLWFHDRPYDRVDLKQFL